MPLALRLLPETAHRLALRAMRAGLVPLRWPGRAGPPADPPVLAVRVFGRGFANPLAMAAGFDKNAEAVDALFALGFGSVEVGTVTPLAQPGNPLPRLFRLPAARALINRNGFANDGLEAVAARLAAWRKRPGPRPGVLGVNLGINKGCADPLADFAAGIRGLARLADYLVINVSSPNTPGLRDLQAHDRLGALAGHARAVLRECMPERAPALLFKIAPDLDDAEIAAVVEVAFQHRIDGLILTNTTVKRPAGLTDRHRDEAGGLSGEPLYAPSTDVLRRVCRLSGGRIPLIAGGGVSTGLDAYRKIRAGASLVQVYTAFAYEGPPLVRRIKADLARLLSADGFAGPAEAVGADVVEGRARAA
ncbi:MAG: quinone-dependent dihydroorotate dehydrogenase [Proteobacteria bacterium]|nr:quinone-dependent dihydroorotate dehydrogenase [Pseudomonadota bacterium]